MKTSLDRAWKIFGRVVARESLIDLSRQLAGLRPSLVSSAPQAPGNRAGLPGNLTREASFSASLERNADSLTRSQGAEWVDAMRKDHASLVRSRAALLRLEEERAEGAEKFRTASANLVSVIRSLRLRAPIPNTETARATQKAPAVRQFEMESAIGSQAAEVPPLPPKPAIKVSVRRGDGGPQRFIAWLSVAALLILGIISIVVTMRIIGPVRKLMLATRRFAEGDLATRVERGGIRELDSLAVSFNAMADRLEAAQAITLDHQQELERRVDERTRQLQHLAEHDPLTELPNRRQLFSQLEAALKDAERARKARGRDVAGPRQFQEY